MKLAVKPRTGEKKGDVQQIRREGDIPAVLYSSQDPARKITVNGAEFRAVLRNLKMGQLPTTLFHLSDGKQEWKAVVKDIQYDLTSYTVSHLDFEVVHTGSPVRVKVPVECVGIVDCVGVKLGGFLRQIARHVKVECLPEEIPSHFQIDVREMGIRQSKRLKDIVMPKGVRPLASQEDVLVVIAKR